jgi:hypothetical protein
MSDFDHVRSALQSAQGYTIQHLGLSIIEERDALDIHLAWGPPKPDITLSVQDIYHLGIGRTPRESVPFLDTIEVVELMPSDDPWPAELLPAMNIVRTSNVPPLLWVRTDGPVRLSIVAAVMTIHQELR